MDDILLKDTKSESAYKTIKYHCIQQDNEEKDNIHKP